MFLVRRIRTNQNPIWPLRETSFTPLGGRKRVRAFYKTNRNPNDGAQNVEHQKWHIEKMNHKYLRHFISNLRNIFLNENLFDLKQDSII